jgi:hypothetical protein
MTMLRDEERASVDLVRSGIPPRTFGERLGFEMIRACDLESGSLSVPDVSRWRTDPGSPPGPPIRPRPAGNNLRGVRNEGAPSSFLSRGA